MSFSRSNLVLIKFRIHEKGWWYMDPLISFDIFASFLSLLSLLSTFWFKSSVVCTHFDENNDNFIQIGGNWQDYGNQSCYLQDEENSNPIDKGKLYIILLSLGKFYNLTDINILQYWLWSFQGRDTKLERFFC